MTRARSAGSQVVSAAEKREKQREMSAEVQLALSLLYSPGPKLGVCDLFSVGLPFLTQNSQIVLGSWSEVNQSLTGLPESYLPPG